MPFTAPELTSFDGPAENPLSDSGKWAQYFTRPPLQRTGTGHVHATEEFVVNGMYYTPRTFRSPCEIFACVAGGGLGAANEAWRVLLLKDNPENGNGYLGGFGGGIGEAYFMRQYDGWGFTGIGGLDTTNPEKIGLRITESTVETWGYFSGAWNMILTANNTVYRGNFYAAIECEEQGSIGALSFACFGGTSVQRQHIYRIVRGKQPA